jgi:hypothetical protein
LRPKSMPLTLRPNADSAPARRKTDHLVMSGKMRVGRIYKRESASSSKAQWLWAINGVQHAPEVMRLAGMTASLEEAKAELQENWEKWLVWANLQEISDPTPLRPPAEPPSSPDSST